MKGTKKLKYRQKNFNLKIILHPKKTIRHDKTMTPHPRKQKKKKGQQSQNTRV
jgi:hypothetical protein